MGKNTHRYIARIVIEAVTPLAVGKGQKGITTDSPVATDANGLPYIPGTAVAGVFRHLFCGEEPVFGSTDDGSLGSRIIFSEAKLVGEEGKPVDGFLGNQKLSSEFYQRYLHLPIRQHVRINHKGTAAGTAKFDEQTVYKGSRFCFHVEMIGGESESELFKSILQACRDSLFRIGGGTRSGFGKIKVINCGYHCFNLCDPDDRKAYLSLSSALNSDTGSIFAPVTLKARNSNLARYSLNLQPVDIFLFGSGLPDGDADATPVLESMVTWENGKARFKDNMILLPASSLKGALAHRTAYHLNKATKVYADKCDEGKTRINDNALRLLFGTEGSGSQPQTRGKVIFSDVISSSEYQEKIMSHNKIDRYSGATVDGALFQDKTVYGPSLNFNTEIVIEDFREPEGVSTETLIKAFEKAMDDVCQGLLPLGGRVNSGYGRFKGSFKPVKPDSTQA